MKNKLVSVAKILNFHGIKGEAKIGFSKKNTDFIQTMTHAFIKTDTDFVEVNILSVKFNNKCAIMKFEGINSIDELMEYKGCSLYVPEEDLKEDLEEEEERVSSFSTSLLFIIPLKNKEKVENQEYKN